MTAAGLRRDQEREEKEGIRLPSLGETTDVYAAVKVQARKLSSWSQSKELVCVPGYVFLLCRVLAA